MRNPDRLLILQRQLVIVILSLLLCWMIFTVSFFFADILRILGISILLAYLGIALVDFLQKYLRDRRASVIVVFVLLISFLIVSALLVVPAVVMQVTQLVQTTFDMIPGTLHSITNLLTPLEEKFKAYQIPIKVVDILNNVIEGMPKPDPSAILYRVTDVAMSTATWLFYWVSISVVTFYFLLEGNSLTEALIKLSPRENQPFVAAFARDADRSLQSFFRGQIILGIAFGIVMLAIYLALKVEYALLLGIFLGFMEILPVIGPPIGFIPAAVAVAIHGCLLPGNKLVQILILTLIFGILQQLKDNVIAPKYIGNVIGLHPILIFIAIMVGARLDGTLGIIFALPAACVLNVLFTHLRMAWSDGDSVQNTRNAPPDLPSEPASPYEQIE